MFIKEKLLNLFFNKGIIKHAKKQENMSIETVHEKAHMLDVLDKDHKLDILNMFKELNKTIQRTKRNYETDLSPNMEYQLRKII